MDWLLGPSHPCQTFVHSSNFSLGLSVLMTPEAGFPSSTSCLEHPKVSSTRGAAPGRQQRTEGLGGAAPPPLLEPLRRSTCGRDSLAGGRASGPLTVPLPVMSGRGTCAVYSGGGGRSTWVGVVNGGKELEMKELFVPLCTGERFGQTWVPCRTAVGGGRGWTTLQSSAGQRETLEFPRQPGEGAERGGGMGRGSLEQPWQSANFVSCWEVGVGLFLREL